jgi:hypothetical protein
MNPANERTMDGLFQTGDEFMRSQKEADIFLCGMSNGFNNILMGIWGNISLICMDGNASKRVVKGSRQVEQLMHHEAALIHLLLGYHAESNATLRRLRLNQLLQHIKKERLFNGGFPDSKTKNSNRIWASRLRNPARLTRCLALLVEQMFQRIEKKLGKVTAQTVAGGAVGKRLLKIDVLIKRGFALAWQLKQYGSGAPKVIPVKSRYAGDDSRPSFNGSILQRIHDASHAAKGHANLPIS